MQCLGWYSIQGVGKGSNPDNLMKGKESDKPTQADLDFMKREGPVRQFCDQEAPLMLLMNPHSDYAESKHKLPAFLYQNGELKDFRLASSDVEQIAVK